MRYPDGHNETVRQGIVAAAARLVRRDGLDRVSIPALMKAVGLTHGGFYSHFKNRDELAAAAVLEAAEATARGVFGDRTMAQVAEHYLSAGHVEHPDAGCVVAALGSDGPRQPARVRAAFAEVARGFLALTQRALGPARGPRSAGNAAGGRQGGAHAGRAPRKRSAGNEPGQGSEAPRRDQAGREPSDEAIVRAATMIGAVVLARLVGEPVLARRILAAARRAVTS